MSSLHSDVDTRSPTVFRITMEGTEIQPRRRRDPVSALPACCRPGRVSHSRRQFANRALRSAHTVDPVAHASTMQQVCNGTKGRRATVPENELKCVASASAIYSGVVQTEDAATGRNPDECQRSNYSADPCVFRHGATISHGVKLPQSFAILVNRSGISHCTEESYANERKQPV